MAKVDIPLLGFAAFSGTGKTRLLTQLLPLLKARGLHVGMIKHSHHRFEIDQPGKDSYQLRKAGTDQMLIVSPYRWALIAETEEAGEPTLQEALDHLDQSRLDLILVEGFRHEALAKIELHRPSLGKPLLYPEDPHIIAIATDAALSEPTQLPVLDLNDIEGIARFLIRHLHV